MFPRMLSLGGDLTGVGESQTEGLSALLARVWVSLNELQAVLGLSSKAQESAATENRRPRRPI